MATPVHTETKRHLRGDRRFGVVYLAMLVLSLHWAVVVYVNSTYLEQFVSSAAIGLLFVVGSSLTIFVFLFVSRVLRELGNYRLTIGLIVLEVFALIGMGLADSLRVAIPLFILHQAMGPLMLFNLDVFMESFIGNREESTGSRRGILLTTMSLAGALAPLAAGFIVGSRTGDFGFVYFASALTLAPFAYIIARNFRTFKDPLYKEVAVLPAIQKFWVQKDLRFVFLAHFLLQLFFAWSVIYVPLYLATVIGFAWSDIGIILFIGLMAYVLLEYPIGRLADNYIGEKEMMMAGFLILAISVSYFSFIATVAIIPWAVAMFMTRVGASLVEATTESYFFKHTKGSDANIISFFRITRPLAIVVGALLGSLSLLYLPFGQIFLVLGVVLLPGILFSSMLNDTR